MHEQSRRRHKIGKLEVSIVLWQALVGAAMGGRGKDGRRKAELGPLLLLAIWKRPNLYRVYLTVEFRGVLF